MQTILMNNTKTKQRQNNTQN